jgi:hypothetical protein
VSSSPLSQKITFLTGKGLTDAEVQQALGLAAEDGAAPPRPATAATDSAQAGSAQLPTWQQTQNSPGPYAPYSSPSYVPTQGMMRPRSPPRRDWRDYFVSPVPPPPSRAIPPATRLLTGPAEVLDTGG